MFLQGLELLTLLVIDVVVLCIFCDSVLSVLYVLCFEEKMECSCLAARRGGPAPQFPTRPHKV